MSKDITKRPTRTPLHKRRMLEAKARPGFRRRWVNEELGAIDAYKDAGWMPVVGDEDISDRRAQTESTVGSVVRRVVNKGPNASAKTAILMEIPEDLYAEDQAAKQREVDKIEASYDPSFVTRQNDFYDATKKR